MIEARVEAQVEAQGTGLPGALPSGAVTETALLALVEATLRVVHVDAPGLPSVTLNSVLDRDLALDSLSRMELLLRVERAYGVSLPEHTLQRAETVADLLLAAQQASAAGMAPAQKAAATVPRELPSALQLHAPAAPEPASAQTLLEVLDWHAQAHPGRKQVTCLLDDTEHPITYGELAASAAAVAAGLQRAGVRPKQTVAIMLPTSPAYFFAYLGILRAGAVPVPIYPPARASQLEDHVVRHTGILDNAQAALLITVPEAMVVARLLQARLPCLRHVTTVEELAAAGGAPTPVAVQGSDIAFIQYTSGSTGNPKGVALTHANLLANIRAMVQVAQGTPDDVFVSWLPLYHDMGLIGSWLAGLYVGFPLVVMSPLAFLARPLRWLQALHHHRGTLSAAPNFAYELCLKRITDAELVGLDLSAWRLAFNGAEAVSPDTVQRFQQRLARCGLRPETVAPVYGLAEACVGLLFPPLGRVAPVDRIQREPFARARQALPAADDDLLALRFVGCGRPLPGHDIRILDDAGRELGERVEGRLEFRGPSATHGYYRNAAQSARLFHDGWLDTGDRAYRAAGDVYITGRVKDIVIRGGRNLYPQEIEEAVGAVDGVRKGCVAVFGSLDPASGTERLVVLAEAQFADATARVQLHDAVSRAVIVAIGEPPDQIVLAPAHTVLKTSSGKVRRSACRDLLESGRVGAVAPTARQQVLRLALGAVLPRLRHAGAAVGHVLYGAWATLLFVLLAPLAWLPTALMPKPSRAWQLSGAVARLLLRLSATPLQVRGLEHLPAGPCVLVCNHGSYLDGVVLVAALPRAFTFVAKRELQQQWIPRIYLQRLGAEFVERSDAQRSVADAERLADAVARGRSLLVFPEGTFVAGKTLLPFHLGAFLAAARAGVPVVPVALTGTREMLPDGARWPHRARLALTMCTPLQADAAVTDGFARAVRLRNAAQRAIELQLDAE